LTSKKLPTDRSKSGNSAIDIRFPRRGAFRRSAGSHGLLPLLPEGSAAYRAGKEIGVATEHDLPTSGSVRSKHPIPRNAQLGLSAPSSTQLAFLKTAGLATCAIPALNSAEVALGFWDYDGPDQVNDKYADGEPSQ
jgi:hypothetical protein